MDSIGRLSIKDYYTSHHLKRQFFTSHFQFVVVPSWLHVNVALLLLHKISVDALSAASLSSNNTEPSTSLSVQHVQQTKSLQQWHGAPGHQKEPGLIILIDVPLESEANTWTCQKLSKCKQCSNVPLRLSSLQKNTCCVLLLSFSSWHQQAPIHLPWPWEALNGCELMTKAHPVSPWPPDPLTVAKAKERCIQGPNLTVQQNSPVTWNLQSKGICQSLQLAKIKNDPSKNFGCWCLFLLASPTACAAPMLGEGKLDVHWDSSGKDHMRKAHLQRQVWRAFCQPHLVVVLQLWVGPVLDRKPEKWA